MKSRFIYIGRQNQTNTIIRNILVSEFDCEVSFIIPSKDSNLLFNTDKKAPDLVLIDLNTVPGNAPENVRVLKKEVPHIPVLALHIYKKEKLIQPLIASGADGFLSTTPSKLELVKAIEALLSGDTYIGNSHL